MRERESDQISTGAGRENRERVENYVISLFPPLSSGPGLSSSRAYCEHFIGPLDKVSHVGTVFVSAVVLTPAKLAVEKAGIYGWHFRRPIILFHADILWHGGYGLHEPRC